MAYFRRFIKSAICFFAAVATVAISHAESGSTRTVSAVWLRGYAASDVELFLGGGENVPVPLVVGKNSRGKSVELSGAPASLRILRRPPGASSSTTAGGKPAGFVTVAEARMPTGDPTRVLLVLASAGSGGGALRVTALPDDEASFPAHTVRVANFTGASILMRLGETVRSVAPGATEPFPYALLADPKMRDVPSFPFALALQNDVFFNGRIDSWPESRTLVFMAPSSGEGQAPAVQVLVDRPNPPAASKVNKP